MASPHDYEVMLQSMSAMSQQFSWNGHRNGPTPQRVLSQRSRIQKSSGRNTSPSNLQRRRTAPTGRRPQDMGLYTQQFHSQPPSLASRPQLVPAQACIQQSMSWHAQEHLTASEMNSDLRSGITPPQFPDRFEPHMHPSSQGTSFPTQWTYSYGSTPLQGAGIDQSMLHPQMAGSYRNTIEAQQMTSLSLDTYSSSRPCTDFQMATSAPTSQSYPSANMQTSADIEDEDEEDISSENDGKVLVGISLYDNTSPAPSTSHSRNSSFGPSQPAGQGLKLEESWAPPPEDIPEIVADDDMNTPTMADTTTCPTAVINLSHEHFIGSTSSLSESTLPRASFPCGTFGEPFVFDEEMDWLANDWAMDGTKKPPVDWTGMDHTWLLQNSGLGL